MNNEPVVWMYKVNGEHQTWSFIEPPTDAYDEGSLIPLYTHPAKTLTDEEITQVFDECYPNNADGDVVTLIDFARAILRKASEK